MYRLRGFGDAAATASTSVLAPVQPSTTDLMMGKLSGIPWWGWVAAGGVALLMMSKGGR